AHAVSTMRRKPVEKTRRGDASGVSAAAGRGDMNSLRRGVAVLALLVAACGTASAQEKKEKKAIPIALQLGAFFPSNSTAKDHFGASWFLIGVGVFNQPHPNQWQFIWDFRILHHSDVGTVTLVPLGFGAQRGLGRHPESQPYVAAEIGPFYGKVHGDR